MSRPSLEFGSWGSISSRVGKTDDKGKLIRYLSKVNFRDHDGHVRDITATGRTKSASERSSSESSRTAPGPTSPASSQRCTSSTTCWVSGSRRALKNHVRPPLHRGARRC
jgi:hypothetical protein